LDWFQAKAGRSVIVSRWDFGSEVKSFYEMDCDNCGMSRAVIDKSQVFEAATEEHLEDCLRPTRVHISKRGEVAPGEYYTWEILLLNESAAEKSVTQISERLPVTHPIEVPRRHPQVKLPNGNRCDEKIRPLVMALWNIPGLRTITSCQEQEFDSWPWAYVCCQYEDSLDSLFAISQRIASLFADHKLTHEVSINWWGTDVSRPSFWVRVVPSEIYKAAGAINAAFKQ
jgi:hypothetical protein